MSATTLLSLFLYIIVSEVIIAHILTFWVENALILLAYDIRAKLQSACTVLD